MDQARMGEGAGQAIRQKPRAAGRHRAIDGGEQAARPLAREGAGELEIGPGGRVDRERRARIVPHRRVEDRAAADLRFLDIEQGAAGRRDLGAAERAERVQGRDAEMLLEPPLGRCGIEALAGQGRDGGPGLLPEGREFEIVVNDVRHQNLARLETGDLRRKAGPVRLAQDEMSCGNIHGRQTVAPLRIRGAAARDGQEVVGAARFEEAFLRNGARGDEAHHVPAHHGFRSPFLGLGGIFGLFADRNPVPQPDQALEVVVRPVHGHPTHGDILPLVLAAFGEHDAEGLAGDFRILEEELVEISHPVEQKAIRIRRLDLDILCHHGRDASVHGRFRLSGFGTLRGLVQGLR
jgi:hypothetical protein